LTNEKSLPKINQLTLQNERLKEALLALRDICTQQEKELRNRHYINDTDHNQLEILRTENETLKAELQKAENTIEDLKISLDDALGAEELIFQLTEKNLNLTDVPFHYQIPHINHRNAKK
jgi:dynactin 1